MSHFYSKPASHCPSLVQPRLLLEFVARNRHCCTYESYDWLGYFGWQLLFSTCIAFLLFCGGSCDCLTVRRCCWCHQSKFGCEPFKVGSSGSNFTGNDTFSGFLWNSIDLTQIWVSLNGSGRRNVELKKSCQRILECSSELSASVLIGSNTKLRIEFHLLALNRFLADYLFSAKWKGWLIAVLRLDFFCPKSVSVQGLTKPKLHPNLSQNIFGVQYW